MIIHLNRVWFLLWQHKTLLYYQLFYPERLRLLQHLKLFVLLNPLFIEIQIIICYKRLLGYFLTLKLKSKGTDKMILSGILKRTNYYKRTYILLIINIIVVKIH